MSAKLAIIGGSGMDTLAGAETLERVTPATPFGEPSDACLKVRLAGRECWFLARHGERHRLAPHLVNYRANLWALESLGAAEVIALSAVGAIRPGVAPGTLALPDQIVDYTWGREHTYFDGRSAPLAHVELTRPYSERLREALRAAARAADCPCEPDGVLAVTQGPRLETAAEIDRLERDGADYVNMTGMPEAALAAELGLDYACLALIVNRAAGRGQGSIHADIETHLTAAGERAFTILDNYLGTT